MTIFRGGHFWTWPKTYTIGRLTRVWRFGPFVVIHKNRWPWRKH